jgi:triosephosphate isomerase
MRKRIVAGNWKMNGDMEFARLLVGGIIPNVHGIPKDHHVVICPPFPYLSIVNESLHAIPSISLGAQNLYPAAKGAFTGEVSPAMLRSLGCRFVIVGHSERRQIFGESDAFISRKVRAALEEGLDPILCIGENGSEREAGTTFEIVERQLTTGLDGISAVDLERIVIAYEPVWAIGTGVTATPGQAEEVHAFIRALLSNRFSAEIAEGASILYGGSVTAENAGELFAQPNVDGGLIGGASLKEKDFLSIIRSLEGAEGHGTSS